MRLRKLNSEGLEDVKWKRRGRLGDMNQDRMGGVRKSGSADSGDEPGEIMIVKAGWLETCACRWLSVVWYVGWT